ncbi:hypothetical protein LINGRAHAP2_LOCUS7116, partial [Linum grandiflorum]
FVPFFDICGFLFILSLPLLDRSIASAPFLRLVFPDDCSSDDGHSLPPSFSAPHVTVPPPIGSSGFASIPGIMDATYSYYV